MELNDLTRAHLGSQVRATYWFGDAKHTIEGELTYYSHEREVIDRIEMAWAGEVTHAEKIYWETLVKIGSTEFTPETLELVADDITSWDEVQHGEVVDFQGIPATVYKLAGGRVMHLAMHRPNAEDYCIHEYSREDAQKVTSFPPPEGVKKLGPGVGILKGRGDHE